MVGAGNAAFAKKSASPLKLPPAPRRRIMLRPARRAILRPKTVSAVLVRASVKPAWKISSWPS